ncbi:hypothetical protein F3Y22_tig00116960pilonHSYRG00011 [Hibiscus syriacus]|uniref:Uncharacterized protein n=1 Tax=Hibiscus syriacus TaxID=106335 RepID=A0A6A2WWZ9_HIBSY|nr:hypothetical protein F3Y22_tig00116960pilonHSYRG00011 [Hibiscus syriacus]
MMCLGAERSRARRSLLTDNPSLSWISFVMKLKSNLEMDVACVHDSLCREVETVSGTFVVKLSLLKLKLKLRSCLLTVSCPFAVKLSLCCLESNILRYEVEIGSEIGKLFVDNQSSLHCEVELVLSRIQYPSL